MILHAHVGEVVHVTKDGRSRRWRPQGPMMIIGSEGRRMSASEASKTTVKRLGGGTMSARLFVGLNVGATPTFSVDDVVKAVVELRKKSPDASVLLQKGIYTTNVDGKVIIEDSVQVIVLDFTGNKKKFVADMKKLGKQLRERFQQETVILEIQNRGVVEDVYSIAG